MYRECAQVRIEKSVPHVPRCTHNEMSKVKPPAKHHQLSGRLQLAMARLRGGVMKTLLSAGMLVAAGHGLEERRQWALSSVSLRRGGNGL
jgi:hypothetical protein